MAPKSPKHIVGNIFKFSLFAGGVGAIIALLLGAAVLIFDTYAPSAREVLIAIPLSFLFASFAAVSWGFYLQASDYIGGRVGGWQKAPSWFTRLFRDGGPKQPND